MRNLSRESDLPAMDKYPPVIVALCGEERRHELGPGRPNESARELLEALDIHEAFGDARVVDRDMASACVSGLWLYHDFLDRSHRISQDVDTPSGSYWHGIMHRREPDPSNAKYWFRRVGDHPVYVPLAAHARRIAKEWNATGSARFLSVQSDWDPFAWIDLCEASRTGREPHEPLCREIALVEWRLLFDHCYDAAVGN